ncbi:MAG TPA: 23S rRNA (guanosine(2251)-2'-O)-methyltransferase RlmB [Acidimicrobiia bacterium]|nr:23S rRNA (guanosine(2251)-2'-O)-methyltransferase RlmB [Acidimicrobiia bacterium]
MARRNEDKVIRNNNKKAHSKIKAQNKRETGRASVREKAAGVKPGRTKTEAPVRATGHQLRNATLQYGLGGEHVEGFHAVDTLIEHGKRRITQLFVDREVADTPEMTKLLYNAERKHVRVTKLSREQFMGRARTEAAQGVIAYCAEKKPKDIDDLLMDPKAFLVALDGVTDPRNIGAIVRSAEVAGATGVILPKHRSGHLSPSATKSAAGAVEFMEFGLVPGIPTFLQRAQKAGVTVYGMAGEADQSLYDLKTADGPIIIVMGSEGKGLSQLVRKRCDGLLRIPQQGKVESLNVSAAAAVTLLHVSHLRL